MDFSVLNDALLANCFTFTFLYHLNLSFFEQLIQKSLSLVFLFKEMLEMPLDLEVYKTRF